MYSVSHNILTSLDLSIFSDAKCVLANENLKKNRFTMRVILPLINVALRTQLIRWRHFKFEPRDATHSRVPLSTYIKCIPTLQQLGFTSTSYRSAHVENI